MFLFLDEKITTFAPVFVLIGVNDVNNFFKFVISSIVLITV